MLIRMPVSFTRHSVYGPGEYFAKGPTTPMSYAGSAKNLIVCELLLGQPVWPVLPLPSMMGVIRVHSSFQGVDSTMPHQDYVVMKHSSHDLPRFIIDYS